MISILFTLLTFNAAVGQRQQILRGGLRSIPLDFKDRIMQQKTAPETCDFEVPVESNCFGSTRVGKGDVGCDNRLCQIKVCECDPYCCLLLWDAACAETNYFFPGCTARELCCEESDSTESLTVVVAPDDATEAPTAEASTTISLVVEEAPLITIPPTNSTTDDTKYLDIVEDAPTEIVANITDASETDPSPVINTIVVVDPTEAVSPTTEAPISEENATITAPINATYSLSMFGF